MSARRVAILAMGSRGDVQPFVALGVGLARAGHDVEITVPEDLVAVAAAHGLRTRSFGIDVRRASGEDVGIEWQSEGSRGLRHEARLLQRVLEVLAEPIADGVLESGSDADVVISGAMTFHPAAAAARERGQAHFIGMLAPTTPGRKGSSTVYAPFPGRTTSLNRTAALLAAAGAYTVFRRPTDLVRHRLGLAGGSLRDYLRTAYSTPTLLACSPLLVPPDESWGAQLRTTGAWALPDEGWRPPPALADFLAAGEPPVYVGFGSMRTRSPRETAELVIAALARTGRRGLVGAGWSGLSAADLPRSVALVDDVPHDWLFPRVAAVVHHGGAGTTHTAARAGVPQLVVPHVADQPYWGRRVAQLGLGPAPMPRHDLDTATLAASIERLTGDESLTGAARGVGAAMAREDGVGEAVRLISAHLAD